MKAGAESAAKVESVPNAAPTVSGALQPEAKIAFQVFHGAVEECSFVKDASCDELKDLSELEISSAVHQNVNLVLPDPSYSTRSLGGQASFAHDVICQGNIKDAERFMNNVISPAAHGHILCSDLLFYHRNMSLRRQKRMVQNAKIDYEKLKEKLLSVSE